MMRYIYLGDRQTSPEIKLMQCDPVRNEQGKCVRGKLGTALVVDATGREYIVIARRLRLNPASDLLTLTSDTSPSDASDQGAS